MTTVVRDSYLPVCVVCVVVWAGLLEHSVSGANGRESVETVIAHTVRRV